MSEAERKIQNDNKRLLKYCIPAIHISINKALPVHTQSSASFVYNIKHIEAERYDPMPKNRSCFRAKM